MLHATGEGPPVFSKLINVAKRFLASSGTQKTVKAEWIAEAAFGRSESTLGIAEGDGVGREACRAGESLQESGGMSVVVTFAVLTRLSIER